MNFDPNFDVLAFLLANANMPADPPAPTTGRDPVVVCKQGPVPYVGQRYFSGTGTICVGLSCPLHGYGALA